MMFSRFSYGGSAATEFAKVGSICLRHEAAAELMHFMIAIVLRVVVYVVPRHKYFFLLRGPLPQVYLTSLAERSGQPTGVKADRRQVLYRFKKLDACLLGKSPRRLT